MTSSIRASLAWGVLLSWACVAPACAGGGDGDDCVDEIEGPSDPATVVPAHAGAFHCVDPADFDAQLALTFDGDGNLIRKRLDTSEVFLGSYGYDASAGAITLATGDGWNQTGAVDRIDKGRLMLFTMGGYTCSASGLYGPCGVSGSYRCDPIDSGGQTVTYELTLQSDHGILFAELGSAGSERYDKGVYLRSAADELIVIDPSAKFDPLGYETTATMTGDALVLHDTSAGDVTCEPMP